MIDDREIGEQDECSGYISMRSVLELGNSHYETFPRSEPRTCPGLAVLWGALTGQSSSSTPAGGDS